MTIICIAIGDEVLGGETREGNGYALAQRVARFGARLGEVRVIADERRALMDALALAAGPGRLVVTSGGLGPTDDDGTRQAVADALGSSLPDKWPDVDAKRRLQMRLNQIIEAPISPD